MAPLKPGRESLDLPGAIPKSSDSTSTGGCFLDVPPVSPEADRRVPAADAALKIDVQIDTCRNDPQYALWRPPSRRTLVSPWRRTRKFPLQMTQTPSIHRI